MSKHVPDVVVEGLEFRRVRVSDVEIDVTDTIREQFAEMLLGLRPVESGAH